MMNENLTTEQLNTIPKEALVFMYEQLLSVCQKQSDQIDSLQKQLTNIQESLALLTQHRFGRKTEKLESMPGQMVIDFENSCIINELELLVDAMHPAEQSESDVIIKRTHKSLPAGKREDDLKSLPCLIVPHELPKSRLEELFPNGFKELPDEVYREVVMHPKWFEVLEHHVKVYADKAGDRIIRADKPARLIPNSVATPSLVAGIINGKYGNANPFNRLSVSFLSHGINIPRQNMARWCILVSELYLEKIFDAMHQELLTSQLIHADESPFKVAAEMKERGPESKCYMWVYHTDQQYGSHPVFLYHYCSTRSADNPRDFLQGYKGILMTDGYQVYHKLQKERPDELKVAGCWAHAKRRFANLIKAVKAENAKGTVAYEANQRIAAIYHLDNMYKDSTSEERLKYRQATVKPLVDALFEYFNSVSPMIDGSSETGKAVRYCLNQEEFLRAFLDNPMIPLDNNDAERSIRSFCVGRANWHIIDSKAGAKSSGILYSIVETAKANGLKVFYYLSYILEELANHPGDQSQEFITRLLPWSDQLPENCYLDLKKKTD